MSTLQKVTVLKLRPGQISRKSRQGVHSRVGLVRGQRIHGPDRPMTSDNYDLHSELPVDLFVHCWTFALLTALHLLYFALCTFMLEYDGFEMVVLMHNFNGNV